MRDKAWRRDDGRRAFTAVLALQGLPKENTDKARQALKVLIEDPNNAEALDTAVEQLGLMHLRFQPGTLERYTILNALAAALYLRGDTARGDLRRLQAVREYRHGGKPPPRPAARDKP